MKDGMLNEQSVRSMTDVLLLRALSVIQFSQDLCDLLCQVCDMGKVHEYM